MSSTPLSLSPLALSLGCGLRVCGTARPRLGAGLDVVLRVLELLTVEISRHRATMSERMVETIVGIYGGITAFQGFLGGAGFRPSTVWMILSNNRFAVAPMLDENWERLHVTDY